MEIIQKNKDLHEITMCIYCANGKKDSQGDFLSPEDRDVLEEAEKNFLESPVWNIDHDSNQQLEGIKILESFITDTSEKIGSKVVSENCWIIKVSVPEHLYIDLEKGNGVSMSGDAQFLEE